MNFKTTRDSKKNKNETLNVFTLRSVVYRINLSCRFIPELTVNFFLFILKRPKSKMSKLYMCVFDFKLLFKSRNVFTLPRQALRERLRTNKVFTKDHCFYLNYHKFSIKSYVLDVY